MNVVSEEEAIFLSKMRVFFQRGILKSLAHEIDYFNEFNRDRILSEGFLQAFKNDLFTFILEYLVNNRYLEQSIVYNKEEDKYILSNHIDSLEPFSFNLESLFDILKDPLSNYSNNKLKNKPTFSEFLVITALFDRSSSGNKLDLIECFFGMHPQIKNVSNIFLTAFDKNTKFNEESKEYLKFFFISYNYVKNYFPIISKYKDHIYDYMAYMCEYVCVDNPEGIQLMLALFEHIFYSHNNLLEKNTNEQEQANNRIELGDYLETIFILYKAMIKSFTDFDRFSEEYSRFSVICPYLNQHKQKNMDNFKKIIDDLRFSVVE